MEHLLFNNSSKMMKHLLVLVALLQISEILCISDEMLELMASLHANCVAETGVSEDLIVKGNKEKMLPDDEKFKCYIKCLLEQTGCISDDGVVDVEATIAILPEEHRPKAEPTIRACGAKTGANACESAWLTHKCYMDNNPANYFII